MRQNGPSGHISLDNGLASTPSRSVHPIFSMLFILAVTLLAIYSSSQSVPTGCGKPLTVRAGSTTTVSIVSEGIPRDYLLHVPSSYNGKNPVSLILSFHGRGREAESQMELSQFHNPTFNPHAISVYPNGLLNSEGSRLWTGDPDANKSINDITFAIDIINHVSEQHCIAPKRVYASGKSNGGGLTNLLACDPKASALIAAFAPVSAANYLTADGKAPPCNPARTAIPMLEFHGWLDATILYEGGNNTRKNGVTPSVFSWIRDWATRDGCSPSQNHTTMLCGGKRPPAIKYSWDCNGVTGVVQHYNISNLKHHWPSITGNGGTTRKTCFDATSLIMDFFGQYELP